MLFNVVQCCAMLYHLRLGVGQIAKFRRWYTHCIVVYISWSMRSPLYRLKVRGISYSVLTVAHWQVLVSQGLRVTFCFQLRSARRPTQSNVGTSDCQISSDNVPSLLGAIIDGAGATNAKSQNFGPFKWSKMLLATTTVIECCFWLLGGKHDWLEWGSSTN